MLQPPADNDDPLPLLLGTKFYYLEFCSTFRIFVAECTDMVIISKTTLRNFVVHYPDSEGAMEQWYALTKEADWKNFAELKKSFNSADAVGNDRYVFNIRGNTYRLIALIIFKVRTVYILFVGTHRQYDEVDAATVTFKK
jgi:mRNA interferase HigB